MSLQGTGSDGGPSAIWKGKDAAERYLGLPVSKKKQICDVDWQFSRGDLVCAYPFEVIDNFGWRGGRDRRGGHGPYYVTHIDGAQ